MTTPVYWYLVPLSRPLVRGLQAPRVRAKGAAGISPGTFYDLLSCQWPIRVGDHAARFVFAAFAETAETALTFEDVLLGLGMFQSARAHGHNVAQTNGVRSLRGARAFPREFLNWHISRIFTYGPFSPCSD